MIKYKIEDNNADEFRTMIMGIKEEAKEKVINDNGICPICGGTKFSTELMEASHFGANGEYKYQGKMCLSCNYIKPNKL